jgi:uncharacterized protein (TIGR03067 family)
MRLLVALFLVALPLWGAPAPFLPRKMTAAVEADLKALQGEWELIRLGRNGRMRAVRYMGVQPLPDVFTGDSFKTSWLLGVNPWRVSVDPRTSPKRMSLSRGGRLLPCVYRLEGDNLTLCWTKDEKAHPTDFTPGTKTIIVVYQRKKP